VSQLFIFKKWISTSIGKKLGSDSREVRELKEQNKENIQKKIKII
jgi:hypothetical protein